MSKSARYYAGKAPEWYVEEDSDNESVEKKVEPIQLDSRISRIQSAGISQRQVKEEPVVERERVPVFREEEEEMLSLEEEEEEEESEEEEEIKPAVLFKPIFSKTKKSVPVIKDTLEERKITSHEMVVEELKRDLINPKEQIELDVDDTDGINDEEELEAWKLRELSRIKRDALEKEAREREEAEKEENRKKTDKELEEEMAKNATEDKTKIKFLQKYYHKGKKLFIILRCVLC